MGANNALKCLPTTPIGSYPQMDVLELRLRELQDDVDLIVVAESSFTHSMRPKPLHLAEALAAGDPRWAPWASRLRCVALDPAGLVLLQQRGDFHGHEVGVRNLSSRTAFGPANLALVIVPGVTAEHPGRCR